MVIMPNHLCAHFLDVCSSWRTPSLLDMVLVASTTLLQELTSRGTWPISKDKLVFRPGDELVCAVSLTLSLVGSGCAC
jgi:hypothetical protein